jgi:UvrD-like helicase C-terminal domain
MEIEATENAVKDLISEGYSPESIAVLSFRGVTSSQLLKDEIADLAGLRIKKFIGYSDSGKAQWSEGQLFVDTLFRFKGQCADAVVLTEIDFEEWNESAKRRLFVGLSRARLMASLVVSERASSLIDHQLGF